VTIRRIVNTFLIKIFYAFMIGKENVYNRGAIMFKLVKPIIFTSIASLITFAAYAEGEKPYQLTDGAISANAIEGWKTYNGGGCGACHGKGGKGGVGPNLGQSVTTKLSKDDFVNIVANGKSGTLMRPNKTNKRVMDNMDNLYAYLVARGDDVLGPGNLIKMPLGK